MKTIDHIPVWGEHTPDTIEQIMRCARTADYAALCADGHIGMGVPIGGVVAYKDKISPTAVGTDIGCGNKAVRLDMPADELRRNIGAIMDDLWREISFGIGRRNRTPIDHPLFDDPVWSLSAISGFKKMAREQLGTVGSGNHYVDLFVDELGRVWIGVHFGSRGFGYKTAFHFLEAVGAKEGYNVNPVVLDVHSALGADYIECMRMAGEYAYAGRDWVCREVARLMGASIVEEIHNNHNFAWHETHNGEDLWVCRKGSTPAFPGQRSFVGGSMGDDSVILEGLDNEEARLSLHSTVHGAGRVLSRRAARGKMNYRTKKVMVPGSISREMMLSWLKDKDVVLGAPVWMNPLTATADFARYCRIIKKRSGSSTCCIRWEWQWRVKTNSTHIRIKGHRWPYP